MANKNKDKCSTKYCRRIKAPHRTICYCCIKRKQKKDHPIEYTYYVLKNNAKRRGKIFDLTLADFVSFCKNNNYIEKKGVTKKKLHIDRIDATKGYSIDNIQVLTCSENSSKGQQEKNPF